MTLEGLEHIGIAVSDLEEALAFYEEAFGLKAESIVALEERNVRVAFLPLGNTKIELLEPIGEGALSRFLERRGEGLHHIALGVSDIHGSLERMKEMGIRLVDEVPRPGAEGGLVAFLHPQSTRSVLVELCEETSL
jgi:methylmalonyl-CoA epimerase